MPTFRFAFDPAHQAAGLPFGVLPRTTKVDVTEAELRVRFGPWQLATPITNIAGWSVTGPYSFVKTAGPPHLSLADGGVTFATNGRRGLCIRFHDPVAAIAPFGALKHPGATVTVADPEALITALEAARQTAVHS